jgi:predicted O-methyltransferase YrrM
LFWEIVSDRDSVEWARHEIEDIIRDQEEHREKASYNTGSISYGDAEDLYLITRYFKPYNIAEVGTFIGTSTVTMRHAFNGCTIYTCDVSNKICVSPGDQNIKHFYRTPSHKMFEELAKLGADQAMDMVYLDGRLTEEDIKPLAKIVYDATIYVFDDFEGTEKGVANAMMLDRPNYALIYPREGHKTAALIPYSRIEFARQEMT